MSQANGNNSTTAFVDSFGVPEFFCEALHSVEQVGPCRRLMFTIHQTEGDRRTAMGVVKLILPADVLADIAQMLVGGADKIAPELIALERRVAN
jgi:hypothetical protein